MCQNELLNSTDIFWYEPKITLFKFIRKWQKCQPSVGAADFRPELLEYILDIFEQCSWYALNSIPMKSAGILEVRVTFLARQNPSDMSSSFLGPAFRYETGIGPRTGTSPYHPSGRCPLERKALVRRLQPTPPRTISAPLVQRISPRKNSSTFTCLATRTTWSVPSATWC